MVDNVSANHILALVAIGMGILNCFWGYRILKTILGIGGFCAGAAAGWTAAAGWGQFTVGIALLCALAGGLIGALLCIWLYFVGIFLLGAGFGAALATVVLNAAGSQPQLVIVIIAAVVLGFVAVAVQKFMIILSTAFGGAYLLVAGILHFVVGGPNAMPVLFERFQMGSGGALSYLPLACWLVLGVVGVAVQFRGRRETVEVVHERRAET
jgi:hypothetical protein